MQFELDAFYYVVRNRIAITLLCSFIGQFCQVVSLELDAVQLVVAAQFLDFLFAFFGRQLVLAVLVTGEFVVELLFRELLPPFFLRTKTLWDGEERHDGVVVQTIGLYLV